MWIITVSTFIFILTKATQLAYAMQQTETDQLRLVNTIFQKYDKTLRPVVNTRDVTNVTLNPALFSIVEINEAAESITIVQWFRMTWNDVFIQWDPNDYGGMQQLLIPISRIWYPDIISLNMIDITPSLPEEKNYAVIDNKGTILISVDQILTMNCRFNVIKFPFDIQNCTMVVSSWMYTGDQIDIYFKTPTDLGSYNENSDWDLISMAARRSKTYTGAVTTAWVDVYYDIRIQRKPLYYILIFVLPCFIITAISIVGIFSPFNDEGEREEKVTMGLTTLLTMTVIVTLIANNMPRSSEGMPLLAIYVMVQIAIAAIASLMAVVIMYLHLQWTTGNPVPTWIRILDQIVSIDISNSTNVDKQYAIVLKEIQSMIRQMIQHLCERRDVRTLRKEWQRAVQRLDLILMFIFLLLNVIVTVGFLIIGYSNLEI